MDNRVVSVDHYENFPVSSFLCPPRLRPAVAAIYHFARTADDLADEGDASPEQRRADLAAYRVDLAATFSGEPVSRRWETVFLPLRRVLMSQHLPLHLLTDLLDAFEQDVVKQRYADRAELLDYCSRSANPVGRLLLHLYEVNDPVSLRQSDAICTALQLANFWQDLSVDTRRGRLYLPASEWGRHRVSAAALLRRDDSAATRRLVGEMVEWTRELMTSGASLALAIPGRAGWELRLVVQGGLRILDKVEALRFATLRTRPQLRWFDVPVILWRALWMRPDDRSVAGEVA